MFPNFGVSHLKSQSLDDCLIVVNTERYVAWIRKAKKRFCFDTMWAKEEDYGEIINEAWNEWPSHMTLMKIEHTKGLQTGHNLSFSKMKRRMEQLSKKLHHTENVNPTNQSLEKDRTLQEELNVLLERDELY